MKCAQLIQPRDAKRKQPRRLPMARRIFRQAPMNALTNRRIVVNVGNSRTTWAIFDGDKLHKSWSNQTTLSRSQAPDIASDLDEGLNGESVENQIVYICSVVPSASLALIEALHEQGFDPREIRLDMQKGIRGFYPTFGTDRLANCYAAYKIYGSKCDNLLVLDFGTATTISAVSSAGEFLGGMITLGFQDTLTTIGKTFRTAASHRLRRLRRQKCSIV